MLGETDEQNSGVALLLAANANPEQAAQDAQLARRYRTAPAVVGADRDAFKRKAAAEDARPILAANPRLAAAIARQPAMAPIVHDNLEPLGTIETLIRQVTVPVGNFFADPVGNTRREIGREVRDTLALPQQITNASRRALNAFDNLLLGRSEADKRANAVARAAFHNPTQVVQDLGATAGASVLDLGASAAGVGAMATGWATRALGMGEPLLDTANRLSQEADALFPEVEDRTYRAALSGVRSLPVSLISTMVGLGTAVATRNPRLGAAAGAATGGVLSGGRSYAEGRAQGLSEPAALAYGAIDGVLEAGTEMLPARLLIDDLLAPGTTLARTFSRQLRAENLTEQAATFTQDLNRWAMIEANQGKTLDDFLAERPGAAYDTLIATTVMTGLQTGIMRATSGAVGKVFGRQDAAKSATETSDLLKSVMDVARASDVAGRDPETLRALLEQMAEETPAETAFVSPDALEALAQSGVDVDALLPSASAAIAEAQATGRDVAIPLAELVAAATQDEALGQGLLDHVKLDPTSMSRKEAQEYLASDQAKALLGEIETVAAKAESEQAAETDRTAVEGELLTRIAATRRYTAAVTRTYAGYLANFYSVLGSRLGTNAQEAFKRYPINFAAEGADGGFVGQSGNDGVDEAGNGRGQSQTDGGDVARGTARADAAGDRRTDAGGGLQVQAGRGDAGPAGRFGGGGDGRVQSDRPLFLREGRSAGEAGGLLARFTPSAEPAADGRPAPTFTFDELDASDPAQAQRFADAITAGRESLGEEGAQVYVYPVEEYQAMRLFLTPDGLVGFAIKSDGDIVSVFRHFDGPRRAVPNIMALAKQEGGTKLDCFDITTGAAPPLRALYEREGFAVTERMAWDDQYAPEGWPERFGKPDVVMMALPAAAAAAADGALYQDAAPVETGNLLDWIKGLKIAPGISMTGQKWRLYLANNLPQQYYAKLAELSPGVLNWALSDTQITGQQLVDDIENAAGIAPMAMAATPAPQPNKPVVPAIPANPLAEFRDAVANVVLANLDAPRSGGSWHALILSKLSQAGSVAYADSGLAKTLRDDLGNTPLTAGVVQARAAEMIALAGGADLLGNNSQSGYMTLDAARSIPAATAPAGAPDPAATDGVAAAMAEGQAPVAAGRAEDGGPGPIGVSGPAQALVPGELFPAGTDFGRAPTRRLSGDETSIAVDGVQRSTRNSRNEMISDTVEGVVAFWQWFGDSHAVDKYGRPIVFYHGTRAPEEFKIIDLGAQNSGMFFTTSLSTARSFAVGTSFDAGIVEAYLRLDNSFFYHGEGESWDSLNDEGFDEGALDAAREEYVDSRMGEWESPFEVREDEESGTWAVWQDGLILMEGSEAVTYSSEEDAEEAMREMEDEARDSFRDELENDFDPYDAEVPRDVQTTDDIVRQAHGDGYTSVYFENIDEGSGPTNVAVVVTGPDSVKHVKNRGTFETGNANMFEQTRRGAFIPATSTMVLLEKADLSTFLHEAAHFFLETYLSVAADANAPLDIYADVQQFFQWVGVRDIAEWQGMTLDQRRDAHERFARGFEKRLMTGRSPSLRLESLFRTFRAWLVQVYRQMRALDVTVPREIAQVMDRMIATQAEIEDMEAARALGPLFATAGAAGMTAEEWRAYQALGAKATAEAGDELATRSVRDLQWLDNARGRELRRLQARAKAVRNDTRKAVAAEVMARPVFRAMEFLRRGVLDGAQVEGGFKLSIAEVDAILGDAPGAKAIKDKLGYGRYGMLGAENGIHPQQVAELFGFKDGEALIRALVNAPGPKAEIDGITEQRLLEEHGDLTDDVSMKRAADKAVHNEARGRFIAAELAALNKAVGKRKVLAQAAKSFAEQTIARLKVRNLKPAIYTAAEGRAAKAAMKALADGNLATAAAEKRNQLVNFWTARAAMKAAGEIEQALTYFRKFDRPGTRKAIDPAYRDQIDQLLERFDLRVLTNREIDRRKSLAAWIEMQRENGIDPAVPPELIEEAGRKPFKEMTVEEVRGLVDAIKSIEHLGRLKTKLLTAKRDRDFQRAVGRIEATVRLNAIRTIPQTLEANRWIDTATSGVRSFFAMHRKLASLMRQMDGFKDGGTLWELFVRPMNAAGDTETRMRAEATKALAAILEPITKAGGLRKRLYIPEIGGSLSLEGRLAIALNWGNETNRLRIMEGDRWTEAQVDAILETLTAEQWQVVQAVWDHVNGYWPMISAKEQRVTGVMPEKVEAEPFEVRTADNQTLSLRGGYYPIAYDPRRSSKAESNELAETVRQALQGAYTRATTRRGHTKARVESVKRPVRKDLGVVFGHVTQVIHDLAWHEWLIDANRLLAAGPIDAAIREHYGPDVLRTLKDAVRDIAVGETPAANSFEAGINYLRSGVTIAGLGWNLMTSLLQPIGLTNSIRTIGPKWVAIGVARTFRDTASLKASSAWVSQRSEFMAGRATTQQREISEIRNKVARDQNAALTAVQDSFFWMISRAQRMADLPTWIGAYEKAMATDASDEARAVALADQAVLDSQGGGQIKDLAAAQRGGPLFKLWTNFYSYMNLTYNQIAEEVGELRLKGPKHLPYFLADVALVTFIPVTITFFIRQALGLGDDDDDETIAQRLATENLGFLMGTMIGLREFGAMVTREQRYTSPAGLRFLTDIAKLKDQVVQGEADEALWRAANAVGGVVLHYPSGQIDRMVRGYQALADGETQNPLVLLTGPERNPEPAAQRQTS